MEDQFKTFEDYVKIVRRRKWQLILPMGVVLMSVAIVATLLPAVYRSTGTILIEQQEIPSDIVRSAVTSYAEERIHLIARRVMTTENLAKIMRAYDLYADVREEGRLASAAGRMRDDVSLSMINADVVDPRSGRSTEATIAFSLSYDSPSPILAQKVTNEIITLFLEANLKERKQIAQDTSSLLEGEAGKLADEISSLEAKLATFKEEHGDKLPELMELNLQLLQRTEDELRENEQSIRSLEERRIYLWSELAQLEPYDRVLSASGAPVLTAADRLRALGIEYLGVASRYSPKHPDRIGLTREIAALRREVARTDTAELERQLGAHRDELAMLRERYTAKHPDVKKAERKVAESEKRLAAARRSGNIDGGVEDADNPAYVELQAHLSAADHELAALREVRIGLEKKLADYEERVTESPKIEREYLNLTRDYDNDTAMYREIKSKQMEAQLTAALETESKGERLTLIEPPLLPEKPLKPNRLAILFLGFVLSAGFGMGNVVIREATDKTVRSARTLQGIMGSAPLAIIPFIETPTDRRRRRTRKVYAFVGSALTVAAGVTAVHVFVMPLDVLWSVLMDKLGVSGVEVS